MNYKTFAEVFAMYKKKKYSLYLALPPGSNFCLLEQNLQWKW